MASIVDRGPTSSSDAPIDGEARPEASLRWLGPLWALAILLHLMGNGGHLASLDRIGLFQVVLAISAAAMLVRSSWPLALWLAAVEIVVLWLKLPRVGNHEVILGLVSLAIGLSALIGRRRWMILAAPACRLLLLVAYGSIAFSKLNVDFLDPAVSCAVVFGDELGQWIGLQIGESNYLWPFVVYGTAAVELSIPVLLMIRRARNLGVALALGFHFLLAIDPIGHVWDFSSTLLPLFLLFANTDVWRRLDRGLNLFTSRSIVERSAAVAVILVGHWVLLVGGAPAWLIAYPLWLVLGGGALWLAAGSVRAAPAQGQPMGLTISPILAPVVALAFLNGVSPYLELRSAAAFNMYSNLQITDGASNHLIIPPGLALRDAPRLVEVVDAPQDEPLAYYLGSGLLLPESNLAQHVADRPEAQVLVSIDGSEPTLLTSTAGSAPSGVRETIGHKLGFRRAVDAHDPVRCLRAWGPLG